jgi:hypothetical protein
VREGIQRLLLSRPASRRERPFHAQKNTPFAQNKNNYSIFFPESRLRAPFTEYCNEMHPPYWLFYSTNQ